MESMIEILQKSREYWTSLLTGFKTEDPFIYDFPRTRKREEKCGTIQLQDSICRKLITASNKDDLRLFILLLASLKVLVMKISGSKDICFGVPVLNAHSSEYGNCIIVRSLINPEQSYRELLNQVKRSTAEGYKNYYYPVQKALKTLKPGSTVNPFRFIALMDTIHDKRLLDEIGEKYENDLVFYFGKSDGKIVLKVMYNAGLYKNDTILFIMQKVEHILTQVFDNPDKAIKDYKLISEEEENIILNGFNSKETAYPSDKTIHMLFEEQSIENGDKIAVYYNGKSLSYRELSWKSDRLAEVLAGRGVKSGDVIGIMCLPSTEMIIGLLAILKAGGAYLPLDPDYPVNRIKYMLEDSQVDLVLIQPQLIEKINQIGYGRELVLFEENIYDEKHSSEEWIRYSCADDLAYILYTSGSTGKPKGVLIEHKGVTSLVMGANFIELKPSGKLLMTGSFAFDITTFEIWGSLLNGLTLYLIDKQQMLDSFQLGDYIKKHEINILHLIPQLFNQIAAYNPGVFEGLEYFMVGGDLVKPRLVNEIRERFKDLKILHMYGPTENTTFSLFLPVETTYQNTIPIGRPVSNSTAYIFNEYGQLQPVGVPGEIYVGGAGLARGYLNRPDLTQDRFIQNPCRPSERVYKTGDQGKWLTDGTIEFLGRKDNQVKIRSSRLEISEIESILSGYKDIRDAIIAVKSGCSTDDEEKRLCAYIVSDQSIDINSLRNNLSKDLPDYMIPSEIIQIPRIPLTSNGKVDYRALETYMPDNSTEYTPSRDSLDEKIIEIWSKILSVNKDRIGIDSNFFELGGHSLKTTVLVSLLHKELDVKVPVSEVFKSSTVRKLSDYIKDLPENIFMNIPHTSAKEGYVLSSAQERLFALQNIDSAGSAYSMTEVYTINGEIDIREMERVFSELIKHHESLRTSFEMRDGEILQIIHEPAPFKIEYLETAGNDIDNIIQSFIQPYDLGSAPLMRVGLAKVNGNRNILILDVHHIIADGVSCNILMRDFTVLYNGLTLNEGSITYKDYSEWQQTQRRSNAMKKQKEYWLNELSGEIPLMDIRTDYPRPAVQSTEGDRIRFTLDKETVLCLQQIADNKNATMFMVLTMMFHVLLYKLSGQEDIVIGTVTSGRNHSSLEDVVGMFANTVPVRLKINSENQWESELENVKNKVLGAFENQDYQLDDIISDLKVARNSNRNPLFDVMIVMQNMDKENFEIPGALLAKLDYGKKNSKFDLTMFVVENQGEIVIELEYCSKLFKRSTIEKFGEYYTRIVTAVLKNPLIKIKNIELASYEYKNWYMDIFNRTQAEYSDSSTIHKLFDICAGNVPENTAIIHGNERFTYKALKELSDKVALRLKNEGIQRGDVVAIIMNNSPELVIGILGILKSGAAYLPVDPDSPSERVKFMLEDSDCKAVFTKDGKSLPGYAGGIKTICMEERQEEISLFSGTEFHYAGHSEDIAYIIYTSGSTGTPKGCPIKHRGVINYIEWAVKQYFRGEMACFPLFSSIAFDLTVTSLFAPLLSGNAIAVYQRELDVLSRIIKDNLCNIIKVTPTHLKLLLDMEWEECSIRKIIVGGEQLNTDIAERIYDKFGSKVEIYNEYGPTETAVGCMIHKFNPEKDVRNAVPIGVPAQNVQVYILDKDMNICPCGVPGEMYIAGAGVSPGYINRDELTRKSFIPNPFSENLAEQMYRTGDYAFLLEDGIIEYIGRRDSQVKIRGHRIEIEEIERNISGYPGIKNVVVALKNDKTGNKCICAYFIPEVDIDTDALKNYLSLRMPDYMLPSFFFRLDFIPMLPHGKTDIAALPEPDIKYKGKGEAPESEIELFLYKVWSENLKITDFGVDDSFFEIGGNSFLLTKVHIQISSRYPNIKVTDYFKFPTISALSDYIESIGTGMEGLEFDIKELSVQFPHEYFDTSQNKEPEVSYTFKLTGEKAENINRLAGENGVDTWDIVVAVFAFLISNISGSDTVKLQSMHSIYQDKTINLNINISKESEISEVYQAVHYGLESAGDEKLYDLKDSRLSDQGKEPQTIIPFIGKRKVLSDDSNLTDYYDAVLIMDDDAEMEISFTYSYNRLRLSQERMEEFINIYAGLLNSL